MPKQCMGFLIFVTMLITVLLTAILFFLISLVLFGITVLFDSKRVVLHWYTCRCLAFWAFIIPLWKIDIKDREKINHKKQYVIIANHQSQLDIFITALLFCHFKWVSKDEILKVPVIGWQMALNRYITIKRGYVNSIAKMMKDCETAINKGSSVLIFPEGTRSTDGKIKPFKPGAFILAEKPGLRCFLLLFTVQKMRSQYPDCYQVKSIPSK